ncbi:AcrR family transcriptional regulator [Saccharopolyspora lacisalsi]|uniref:AcrR family transcriptional regulator n=1 Tax=Halosaccharopolyspora lacisalsi TaxID=1000566 RepID=A0A839E4P8_9PSEU|nr:TetR/AcrR family transcriptional regulator [Halosaccharopolyspora lacisalsi]MBA8826795.1 AcrR family transcriptional regulator [Halosaccharopolyspora lacisalsi]
MSTDAAPDKARPRGRPRDPDIGDAVMHATVRRLAEDGYTRMSLGDIAADAGTTRPTLYRRWPGKRELVAAVLEYLLRERMSRHPEIDFDTLPAIDALKAMVRWLHPGQSDPDEHHLLGNVFTESRRTPELFELYREYSIKPRTRKLTELLRTLQQRGAVREDVSLDHVVTLLFGSNIAERVCTGENTNDFPDRVVDLLWPAIATDRGA